MAKKSANIMVRVEPEVKAKAEAIMSELGVPASVVVNMLYKHIIRSGGIPFPTTINEEDLGELEEMVEESIVEEIDTFESPELPQIPGLRISEGAKKIITILS